MPITLSEAAAEQVKNYIADNEGAEDSFLRLGISGGGCSGLQYSLSVRDDFDPQADMEIEQHGVRIVTQKKMYLHLDQTTIDFQDGPSGQGFAIDNPNVPRGGGCPGCGGH